MEGFPWPPTSLPASHDGGMNLLDGDNLLLDLDDKTLQCLVGGGQLPAPALDDAEAGPSNPEKRRRQDNNFSAWLANGFPDEGEADEEGGGEDDSTGDDAGGASATAAAGGGGTKRKGRRKAGINDAAAAKATREKARRERLNEFFDELSRLCDPSGKSAKGDRVSVVADAIRVVQQLRVENNQLKQLNKFLEERVASNERLRAQAMFQQQATAAAAAQQAAAYAQLPQQPQPQQAVHQLTMAQQHQLQQLQNQQQLHQHQQQQQLGQTSSSTALAGAAAAAAAGAAPLAQAPVAAAAYGGCDVQPVAFSMPAHALPPGATPGVQYALVPIHHAGSGTLGAQLVALKQEHMGGAPPPPQQQPAEPQQDMPPGAPAVGWLPAPDLSHDQKLRPPAA